MATADVFGFLINHVSNGYALRRGLIWENEKFELNLLLTTVPPVRARKLFLP